LQEFINYCQLEKEGREFVTLYLKTSPECKDLFGLFEVGSRPDASKV